MSRLAVTGTLCLLLATAAAALLPGAAASRRGQSADGNYRFVLSAHDIDHVLGFHDAGFDDRRTGLFTIALTHGMWRLHHKDAYSAIDVYGTYITAGDRVTFRICDALGEPNLDGLGFSATSGPGSLHVGKDFPNPDLWTVYGQKTWTRTSQPVQGATQRGRCGSRPRATLETFSGSWIGHTRSLIVSKSGRAKESIGDGCCDPIADLTFVVTSPRGDIRNARADIRVTSVRVHNPGAYSGSAPHVGQRGTLVLRDGVMHEPVGGATYCDWETGGKGVCGA